MNSTTCWLQTVFQLIQRLTNRFTSRWQHLTDELQLAAATFHLNTLASFNSRAQIRINGILSSAFFPDQHPRAKAF